MSEPPTSGTNFPLMEWSGSFSFIVIFHVICEHDLRAEVRRSQGS